MVSRDADATFEAVDNQPPLPLPFVDHVPAGAAEQFLASIGARGVSVQKGDGHAIAPAGPDARAVEELIANKLDNNPDTLLVANSGGTNISRVYIGSSSAAAIHEDLAHRILTRATYTYNLNVSRDENTGKIRLTAIGPILYSDRPQYIAQAAAGTASI